jgi:hypothetical protein
VIDSRTDIRASYSEIISSYLTEVPIKLLVADIWDNALDISYSGTTKSGGQA